MSACSQGPCDIGVVQTQYQSVGEVLQVPSTDASGRTWACYVSKAVPVDGQAAATPRPVVVILPDIFGWELPNTRKIADMLASSGCSAILPDFFNGNSWQGDTSDREKFMAWRSAIDNALVDVILRDSVHFARTTLHARHVGVLGFCWGGSKAVYASILTTADKPLFDASVACYASRVDDLFPALRATPPHCPVLGLFGATDANIPATVANELKSIISASAHATDVVLFEGVGHGFMHRAEETPQALDARKLTIDWFKKYLKY